MLFFSYFKHVGKREPRLTQTTPDTPDASSKLDILLHDGHALGMDGTEIGVLEKMDQKRLGGFLKSQDRMRLPAQLGADFGGEKIQGNLANQSREWQLSDEQVE